MAKQQTQQTAKQAKTQENPNMSVWTQQMDLLKKTYAQVTGGDPDKVPRSPIPPEVDPADYVRQGFEQLQGMLGQLHGAMPTPSWTEPPIAPSMCRTDAYESPTHWQCAFELPGVEKNDIKLDIAQGMLHIQARRKGFGAAEWRPNLVEIGPCTYERRLPLPPYVRTKSATARLENGILYVQFERVEAVEEQQQHTVAIA